MNKDALLATLIGFGVGLLVTSIVLFGPNLLKAMKLPSFPAIKFPNFSKPTATPVTPSDTGVQKHFVKIDSPLPEAVIAEEKFLVSGTTTPKAIVIISTDSEDVVSQATDDGKYAGKVTLSEGKNSLTVLSITKDKQQEKQTLTVYYTPEKL